MSSNNSSHSSFAEHQQQQQQQQQHTIYSTSTVDGVVVTTAKSETYSYVSKTIATSPVSKDGVTDDDDVSYLLTTGFNQSYMKYKLFNFP